MGTYKKDAPLSLPRCILFILCCIILAATCEPCSNVIEVNSKMGLDCSGTTHHLVNITCSSLADVLKRVAIEQMSNLFGECIEVIVQSGNYVVTERIVVQHNMVLRGTQNVTVAFSLNETLYPANTPDPYYVLTFADSDYSGISGINFHTSPGIIVFQDVTNVTIEDCSFRYIEGMHYAE